MARCCDFGTCMEKAMMVATYKADRGETRNKFACGLVHQLGVGREITTQGW